MQARFLQEGIPDSSGSAIKKAFAEILGVLIFRTLEGKSRRASSTIQVELKDEARSAILLGIFNTIFEYHAPR